MGVSNLVHQTATRYLTMTTFTVIFAVLAIVQIVRVVRWRIYIRHLKAKGLPMPPHSLILGHLPLIIRVVKNLPQDAHTTYLTDMIREEYPDLHSSYYLDLMPFANSLLVVGTPEMHQHIAQDHVLQKLPNLTNYVRPLCDGLDMLTMVGAEWKRWRNAFNPGFSSTHLMTLVPAMVSEVETYCQMLDEHVAKQDIFRMKDLTDYLTLDIIGRIVLGEHFNSQRVKSRVIESLRTQIRWFTYSFEANKFDHYNPLRPFVQAYHKRIVNAYISQKFDERLAAYQKQTKVKQTRSIIDLAISSCSTKNESNDENTPSQFDPRFKQICTAQVKLFLFSGHDTTSSSLCYHLYLLSQNPKALAQLRKEHDTVFGSDHTLAMSKVISSPHLLNQLPYTTAVIKESLRLFPTVTISRRGEEGFSIQDRDGRSFPTSGFLVFPNTHSIQHDPRYWPQAQRFIPERYIVGPDDPLHPVKGAWRGFEHGPRNCIGQELAMSEMKLALVAVARAYDFKPAYEEVYRKNGEGFIDTVLGEKAYQVGILQPRGDFPLRVERRTP